MKQCYYFTLVLTYSENNSIISAVMTIAIENVQFPLLYKCVKGNKSLVSQCLFHNRPAYQITS